MKKLDLIGKRFNKLTVIARAENIPSPAKKSGETAWKCQCDCGNVIVVRTSALTYNSQKSCGCLYDEAGKLVKVGDKFNKLTAVSYNNGKWTCKCDCGKITKGILTHRLVANKVLSCGCARKLSSKENIKKTFDINRKYTPRIASARRRWRGYYDGMEFTINFEDWLELTQKNCHYCGSEPKNVSNAFLGKKDAAADSIKNGDYIHNGIDRVDVSGKHSTDNVVPCCIICNRVKTNRSVNDFLDHIKRLKTKFEFKKIETIKLPEGYILTSIKDAYRQYKRNYGVMELTLEEFYSYSQLPCFYCDVEKSNCINTYLHDKKASKQAKAGAKFEYNGIDRIDSSKGHTADNVVPCCKYCNFGKGKLSFEEFVDWIERIKKYQL